MADWRCRGIRGATTVEDNERDAILAATRELLVLLIKLNDLDVNDIVSVIFSTTPDLNAEFPAFAARQLGWHDTALICTHEMAVPGALARCIRVLIHWNTCKSLHEVRHVYIRGARHLRPDREEIELPEEVLAEALLSTALPEPATEDS